MSTSVIRPGTAQQSPLGKNVGMLVGILAAAIVLGFAFYLNQSRDATVSGVEARVGQEITDSWLIQHQADQNAAYERAGAAERARLAAMAEAYAAGQVTYPGTSREIVEQALADLAQEQAEASSEAFGTSELLAPDRANQAWSDRLTGLAAATVGMDSPARQELFDKIVAQESQGESFANQQRAATEAHIESLNQMVNPSGVNPAFAHEFEPEPSSGSSDSGNRVTVPAR